jgi:uncharacterized protein YegP (UPF0339 family)
MAAKFEVYKSGEEFRWRLKAGNGEIVASGEGYASKSGAVKGIRSVRRAALLAGVRDGAEHLST